MTSTDLEFALSLTTMEGWISTEMDFEEILDYDPEGSFIGEIEGKPIGMVCTVPYSRFGFIGNLIVLPQWRGRGYGELLMRQAMDYLNWLGVEAMMLDGVPKAVPLYENLGFRKICKSLRLEGKIPHQEAEGVRSMLESDLGVLNAFDSVCFGGQRLAFLRNRLTKHPELCKIATIGDTVTGYIMGSVSGPFVRIGPWVVKGDPSCAEGLLCSVGAETNNRLVKIGVLETNQLSRQILEKFGFRETSHSWRMSTDPQLSCAVSDYMFAICSPARG